MKHVPDYQLKIKKKRFGNYFNYRSFSEVDLVPQNF